LKKEAEQAGFKVSRTGPVEEIADNIFIAFAEYIHFIDTAVYQYEHLYMKPTNYYTPSVQSTHGGSVSVVRILFLCAPNELEQRPGIFSAAVKIPMEISKTCCVILTGPRIGEQPLVV